MRNAFIYILLFVALIWGFIPQVNAQNKRAFMVGISEYDTDKTGYEWNNIHGKEDVLLIAPILRQQGFKVSPVLDTHATYKNITQGLKSFTKQCMPGDIVYIHFSCHGQPFEDKNGDEPDGWDESIVPIDAWKNYRKGKYEGKNHIIDDELKIYTDNIRKKIGPKGFLYVIVDACHAGTIARGDNDTRGTMIAFSSDINKIYNPPTDKKNTYKLASGNGMSNVLFIEACRADQLNHEIKINGAKYGALSYNVFQALKSIKLSNNPHTFLNAIQNSMKQKGRWPNNQNIVIEKSF